MKLHTKVVLARAKPSFELGLATRPSTRCTFTQRKIVWCTGTCQTGTQTLRRSSVSQWMQPHTHRWMRAIHLSGTVWVVVDEHYILFTSIIAQLCERSSRNVACQSSSYLQRASILIQSNCCLTT